VDTLEKPIRLVAPGRRLAPPVELDERAARRTLRAQVARLEGELGAAFASASPCANVDWGVAARGGPRVLGLGELETLRDALAERLRRARIAIAERAEFEAANRRLVEQMMLAPGRHKFVRVRGEDVGERGCGVYEVRPRLGLIGMLMGWWQVKLSSGCPLATGPRPERRGPSQSQALADYA
jgi:hypothetical protein